MLAPFERECSSIDRFAFTFETTVGRSGNLSQFSNLMSWTQEEWDAWKQGTWGQQTAASPATPPSWTKPKDFGSPHGPSDKHDTNLPKTFHSDRNFYDTNEVYGLQFPRQVQASSWAQKHQLAGRDITSLKLHELCWQGWNNFALRSLAQGRYASILFARSIKEATFMSFLMQKFRESKADLDQFAHVYCDQQGLTVDSSLSESAQKSAKMKHLGDSIFYHCKQYQQQELCDAQERIKELEQQLVQAQKSAPTSSSVKTPSKRPSAEDPTSDNKKRRLPIASPASQKPVKPAQTLLQKAFDPNFEASKVLESQAPVSAVPQSTSKWIQNLNLDPKLKEELVQSCKSASATVKSLSEEELATLPQRAADFGFPVRLLTTAKDPDLLKIVLAACALAS